MRKPSPIIMSAVMVPKRPSKGRLARAFAHQQILRPNLTKALRSMGEARGFKVVGRELDLDIVGGIGTDPGRVSALDVEMRLAANPRVEKISINLNSPGGDVLQAQRIYNALRSHGLSWRSRLTGNARARPIKFS